MQCIKHNRSVSLINHFCLILFLLVNISFDGHAQTEFYSLTSLFSEDLSPFKAPAKNWELVGFIHGNFDESKPRTEKGKGVLFNNYNPKNQFKEDANLFSNLEHGDIFLSLDFLMPKGSNSGIYLQGRYEIQLFDSWNEQSLKSSDCGSIYQRWDENRPEGKKGYEGHPARVNACIAPNLWQHLEIEFQAPRFDASGKKIQSAKFIRVVMNGVILHENVVLSGPTRAAAFNDEKASGPLMIQGDHGPVAFRNIKYAMLDEFKVDVSDISYQYYEGRFNNDFAGVSPDSLVRSGKTEAIDLKLADNPNNMSLVFTGKLNIKEYSEYHFILKKIGTAKLSIDNEEIIPPGDWWADLRAVKKLDVGEHTFMLSYVKNFSWAPSGIGLLIGKQNSRPMPIHTSSSIPKLPPAPLIDVNAYREPEMVRSFMMHNGKKKTHVVSVGDPEGVHYAYDLNQAALLLCWKDEFLNVTDMWHERGEPQTASAMGATVLFKGRCPVATMANDQSTLPDTLNDRTELIYKGYTLDERRSPKFQYVYKQIRFEDSFVPDAVGKGLTRTINITKNSPGQNLILRLAEGETITKVSDNTFAINNQQYYLQLPPQDKVKAEIKDFGDKKELIIRLIEGISQIKYQVLW